VVDEAEEEVD
jgi:superfamily II DNA helicase RecQ